MNKVSILVVSASFLALAACGEQDNATAGMEAVEEKVVAGSEMVAGDTTEAAEMEEKPSMELSRVRTITAEVLSVDHETRLVSLSDGDGGAVMFTAGENVRNLAQVEPGDLLEVNYLQSVAVEVVDGKGLQAIAAEVTDAVRAEDGEMPGAAVVNTTVEIFMVEDINLENNTFKLKNVAGEINEFLARNPENLKKSKVGDSVIITTTEAVAIEVRELEAE
ncbi:hypothetical protein [Teredinibacter franksiae]|jgi:hypothetical protein|uniref:hypothetical protein n=1 Tax=Teredinibacter franksiae TaxID=2761453 RepID=UPI00162642BF|nr:hypothetical protein [Teredinibacter franksiae]